MLAWRGSGKAMCRFFAAAALISTPPAAGQTVTDAARLHGSGEPSNGRKLDGRAVHHRHPSW